LVTFKTIFVSNAFTINRGLARLEDRIGKAISRIGQEVIELVI